ncbi:MAG: ImmA/IrrE family metallo-endopeptidase [Reyranellaceae bacterium]
MREVRDDTGRFAMRPHYKQSELDRECELILSQFFGPRGVPIPIPTDELTKLMERDTSDFDPGADLSSYGTDVEGVTEFRRGRKPRVRIEAGLAYDEVRENRYRTTLTHEYGHVRFHGYLFELEPPTGNLLSHSAPKANVQVCKRQTIVGARNTDWMEWQAGYVCGSLLMPITQLRRVIGGFQETEKHHGPVAVGSDGARRLVELIRGEFRVSADAARVRLTQLQFIAEQDRGPSLFDR